MGKNFSIEEQVRIRYAEKEIVIPHLGLDDEEERLFKNDPCRCKICEPSYDFFEDYYDDGPSGNQEDGQNSEDYAGEFFGEESCQESALDDNFEQFYFQDDEHISYDPGTPEVLTEEDMLSYLAGQMINSPALNNVAKFCKFEKIFLPRDKFADNKSGRRGHDRARKYYKRDCNYRRN